MLLKDDQRQENAASILHAIGALLSLAALFPLAAAAARHGGPLYHLSFCVFGGSMVVLYGSSTMLHGLPKGRLRRLFGSLDLAGIFLLIAGTCTPFALLSLGGAMGWSLFGLIWALALTGTAFMLTARRRFEKVAAWIYLGMGWVIALALGPLASRLGAAGTWLLVAGGLAYSVGVVFFYWRFRYHHVIWHAFVMLGSFLHFLAVINYVLPQSS